jgi:hypothetical protein
VIQHELKKLTSRPKKLEILRQMMGEIGKPHPLDTLCRFVTWMRLGCPMPANHGEGRHGHLNKVARLLKDFIELLLAVILHCRNAYQNRNENAHRAYMRNKDNFAPNDQSGVFRDQGRIAFYTALHTCPGHDKPEEHLNIEPDLGTWRFPPEYTVAKTDLQVPPSWRPKESQSTQAVPSWQVIHQKGCHCKRDFVCWEIVSEFHSLCKHQEWLSLNTHLLLKIAELAQEKDIPEDLVCSVEKEAEWRTSAREYFEEQLSKLRAQNYRGSKK